MAFERVDTELTDELYLASFGVSEDRTLLPQIPVNGIEELFEVFNTPNLNNGSEIAVGGVLPTGLHQSIVRVVGELSLPNDADYFGVFLEAGKDYSITVNSRGEKLAYLEIAGGPPLDHRGLITSLTQDPQFRAQETGIEVIRIVTGLPVVGAVEGEPTVYELHVNETGHDETNTQPVITNESVFVPIGQTISVDLLANDSDADNDTLTVQNFSYLIRSPFFINGQPPWAEISLSNNILTITPTAEAAGTETIFYDVTDGREHSDGILQFVRGRVEVTFEPNSAPSANDDTATVSVGDSVLINVGLNDGDDDNDLLATSILTLPTQGTAVVSDNTNFYDFVTYTPNDNAAGTDSFTYEVNDGKGGTNTARVDITIDPADVTIDITGPEVYRFFNTQSGNHFYSRDEFEANSILTNLPHFRLEGPAFKAADPSNGPTADVFRFFNTGNGAHLFTQDTDERDFVIANLDHFNFEGVAYQGHPDPVEGSIPLYRFLNTQTGSHFYTTNENEKNNIIATASDLYNFENIAYHVYRPTDIEFAPVQSDPIPLLGVSPIEIETDIGAL